MPKTSERQRKRQVRLTQTVAPFGVGNLYDFLGESFIACDTYRWKHHGDQVDAPRLAKALAVSGFRSAPVQWDNFGSRAPGIPYYRFPQWLFCQNCRRMSRWKINLEKEHEPATCSNCAEKTQLVPMRFVIACADGHLGDIPWERWVHFDASQGEQQRCQSLNLTFRTIRGAGSGLDSLRVKCETCKAERSLKGITNRQVGGRGLRCPGKQPWERYEERRDCVQVPEILQRGASNLYFSNIVSAIDIPPHSNYSDYGDLTLRVTSTDLFRVITAMADGEIRESLIETLSQQVACTADEVRAVLMRETDQRAGSHATALAPSLDLETDEWHALIGQRKEQDERDRFITRHVPFLEPGQPRTPSVDRLADLIDKVVLVTRLREVRALAHFSRILPEQTKVRPGLHHDVDWLPAIEVFGEGIFLSLKEGPLREWEADQRVVAAAASIEARRMGSIMATRLRHVATPRFLLLHTLAHLLIRQLTFECGYSASSIRERIYSRSPQQGDPQAGLLLYTAAGDVEGTLGGLVRQGEPPRLSSTLLAALERGAWCSADPICRESKAQGFLGLNRGACHACSLVAETSCDFANALLDRSFLVGGLDIEGYFAQTLAASAEETLRARG
jgi:hypothetical protein